MSRPSYTIRRSLAGRIRLRDIPLPRKLSSAQARGQFHFTFRNGSSSPLYDGPKASDTGKGARTAVACFCPASGRDHMLDLINSVLNPLLNGRRKNWIETANSAEHSWQQHVERKNISTV